MRTRYAFPRPAPRWSRCGRGSLALLTLLVIIFPVRGTAADSVPRVLYPESIRPISPAASGELGGRAPRSQPRVVRAALTAAEAATTMDFALSLRMRNFAELQARVARGEIIPRAEMAQKYLPLPADYDMVAAWAVARGFTLTYPDASNLTVFARGPVSRVAEVFQTTFGRVSDNGSEFTSALTAPSMPMALAPALLGINGLQPHLRAYKQASATTMRPMSLTSPNSPPYVPTELRRAYNATTTGLTGAGQTIAIIIDTYLLESDLTTFWANCGVSQVPRVARVVVASGSATDTAEATIDAELTSSMAPGAVIRIYTVGDLLMSTLNLAYHQVYNDLPSQPGLHQLNLSYGTGEARVPDSLRADDSQIFAALAAAGVTICASTGDGGSNPDPSSGNYSASATLQPILPAADPSVTGVGGTTLILDITSGGISNETGWSLGSRLIASGGGASNFFSRPSWQVGTGVPAGNQRLVPDVSLVADPDNSGCYIVLNSSTSIFGGTSISAPIWSGFCALINQARVTAGQQPLGLFGPRLYPLIGSASLHDTTSGNNGAYNAGIGYDMVTGVGTPDVAALVQALGATNFAPTITTQPAGLTVAAGQNATFTVAANGSPAPGYRWQRQAAGSATWANVSDAVPYSGTATATLTVSSVTEAMSGDGFQCVITNSVGGATTSPAALIVASPLTIATLAGSAGVSGSADGTGSAARFNGPSDVAFDGAGNAYVTDTNNHTIRKITPAGVVSTLAGLAGTSGSADGTGSAARFHSPTGITVDGLGNLFVADTENHTIREITRPGRSPPSPAMLASAATTMVPAPISICPPASRSAEPATFSSPIPAMTPSVRLRPPASSARSPAWPEAPAPPTPPAVPPVSPLRSAWRSTAPATSLSPMPPTARSAK